MLSINKIKLALIALAAMVVVSWAQPEEDYNYVSQQPYGNQLNVKVWVDKGDKATYEPGEDIRVYFKTNRDAYVIIYDIDTRGNVHLLYPYDFRDSRFVEGNRPYRIPSLRDDYYLKVNGPEGTEKIVALATREPFYLPDLGWDLDPDNLTEEDYYYMSKPEGEDIWDFIERLDRRIVPEEIDYEINVATFQVTPKYPKSYYTSPSFYFSYRSYPYWYSPDYYFGAVYFDYPFHAAIYIDGIFFGYTPYYLPYFLYGRHYVTIYNHGYLVYRDYFHVRPHYRNTFFVPRDRIYKNYTQRYAKDYRVIKEKPEIFWTKVRELNTKYKYTPAIKDDFRVRKTLREKSGYADKYKGQSVSEPKLSKEKLFRQKLNPTTGDQLVALKGNKEKSTGSDKLGTPEKRLRQEKESQFKEKLSKGDDSFRSEMKESPEKKIRQSKEDQFRKQDEFSKDDRADKSFKSELNGSPEKQLRKSKESQFRQQEKSFKGELSGKSYKSELNYSPEKQLRQSKESRFREQEKTFQKGFEERGSGEFRGSQEAKRSQSNFKSYKVESPNSAGKFKGNSHSGSRQQSSFKTPSRSAPTHSGRGGGRVSRGKR